MKKLIKKLIRFYLQLIKSGTGYNSKTFIMLWGVGMITIVMFTLLPLIYISVLNGLVVPWYGIATFIGSLSTLAGVLIWGKVKTDGYEYQYRDNVIENEPQEPQSE